MQNPMTPTLSVQSSRASNHEAVDRLQGEVAQNDLSKRGTDGPFDLLPVPVDRGRRATDPLAQCQPLVQQLSEGAVETPVLALSHLRHEFRPERSCCLDALGRRPGDVAGSSGLRV